MMKRLLLAAVAACAAGVWSVSAATYELTVDSDEQALDAAMAAAYPEVSLAAGDTIVKRGAGTLTDSESALAKSKELRFEICAGAFVENIARTGCTYCVSNGAAVEVAVDLKSLASSADKAAFFVLNGSGTAARPGALYFTKESSTSNQYIMYELLGDSVICSKGCTVQISSSSKTTSTYNIFTMNGHSLRFVNTNASKYFRFRNAVSFYSPGEITFDNCGVTKLEAANVYVKTAAGGAATTIPSVKLVNGAKLNCVDDTLISKVDVLDCEDGTHLCKVGTDNPIGYTVGDLVGAPAISSDQVVTVGSYRARATDLMAGKRLTSAGSLSFADDAGVGVEDIASLDKNVDYTLVETAEAITGSALADFPADVATLTAAATSLSVRRVGDFPPESFVVSVPSGFTYTYAQVTDQCDPEQLVNKTLYKIGQGQLDLDVCLTNELGVSALTNLVVAQGICRLTHVAGLPIQQCDETHAVRTVTVLDGATFRNVQSFVDMTTSALTLSFTLAGEGVKGLGALCFGQSPGNNNQRTTYTLAANTTITKSVSSCTFSSSSDTSTGSNVFYLNGHDLTFKNAPGRTDGYFRFRYCVTFDTPGTITFDGCGVTHLEGAQVRDRVTGTPQPLPLVRLVNGAKINCVDQVFAKAIGVLECEPGTEICGVNAGTEPGKTAYDWPTDYTLSCVKGFPTITQLEWKGVWQKITIKNLIVRAADVNAGKSLTATPTLNFTDDAKVEIDDPAALAPVPENGVLLASATEALTGTVTKGDSFRGKPLRLLRDETSLWLCPGGGAILIFR